MSNSTLRIILLTAGLLGVGMFAWYGFFRPEMEDQEKLTARQAELETRQATVRRATMEAAELNNWRKLSLPPDLEQARLNYDRYLHEMCKKSGFQVDFLKPDKLPDQRKDNSVGARTKAPPAYLPLTFQLRGKATVAELTKVLQQFQHLPVLHRVKTLRLERADSSAISDIKAPLMVTATIEALVVQGTPPRPGSLYAVPSNLLQLDVLTALRRGPAGLALVPWVVAPNGPLGPTPLALAGTPRQYAELARKNIFVGYIPPPPPRKPEPPKVARETPKPKPKEPDPPPDLGPDMTPYVYLTFITQTAFRDEAWLRHRVTNRQTRLRTTPGFNTFKVTDETGEKIQLLGKVLRIDDRNVYFQAEDLEIYRLHVGMSVADALEQPLRQSQLKEIGLWVEPRTTSKTTRTPPKTTPVKKEEPKQELLEKAFKELEDLNAREETAIEEDGALEQESRNLEDACPGMNGYLAHPQVARPEPMLVRKKEPVSSPGG